jgi:hypothetical protein
LIALIGFFTSPLHALVPHVREAGDSETKVTPDAVLEQSGSWIQ